MQCQNINSIFVTLQVLNDSKFNDVNLEQLLNIYDIFVTLQVLNDFKFTDVNPEQLLNIYDIFVTLRVFHEDKLIFVKEEKLLNIYDISITSSQLNLEKSISKISLHLSKIYVQFDNFVLNINLIIYIPTFKGIKNFLKGSFLSSMIKVVLFSFISSLFKK